MKEMEERVGGRSDCWEMMQPIKHLSAKTYGSTFLFHLHSCVAWYLVGYVRAQFTLDESQSPNQEIFSLHESRSWHPRNFSVSMSLSLDIQEISWSNRVSQWSVNFNNICPVSSLRLRFEAHLEFFEPTPHKPPTWESWLISIKNY